MSRTRTILTTALLGCALAAFPAKAQYGGPVPESDIDPAVFHIDEKEFLGTKVSKDFTLIDEQGREFQLADKLGKPLILVLSYYTCDGSCSVINQDLNALLDELEGLQPGTDFNVLTISFDEHDNLDSVGVFREHLKMTEKMSGSWTFSTFKNKDDIKPFTDSIGFKYFWSPQDRTFFHPGAFMFLTPEGRLARVLYALNSDPQDIKFAVFDAKAGEFKPGEAIDYALSLCYSYNYAEGKYTLSIPLFVGMGALTVGVSSFAVSVVVFRRRKRGRFSS
ncbi:MAG: SCO family protein [Magnetovibrio sp.]|nr:SCO family protein [Magnetovibrio sp.]